MSSSYSASRGRLFSVSSWAAFWHVLWWMFGLLCLGLGFLGFLYWLCWFPQVVWFVAKSGECQLPPALRYFTWPLCDFLTVSPINGARIVCGEFSTNYPFLTRFIKRKAPTAEMAIKAAKPIHWAAQTIWSTKGSITGIDLVLFGWSGTRMKLIPANRKANKTAKIAIVAIIVFCCIESRLLDTQ